ncbi:hypothetical protein ACHAXT_008922 [Thalassiosira profunda]
MSSAGKGFVKKWKGLMDGFDDYLPLDELIELTRNCTAAAVREGLTKNPWFLQQLLHLFYEEDPQEMIEIVRLLLDICPEAAGIPEPWHDDPDTLVYPLHVACQNNYIQNEVIELLLKKSTAGLDHMAAFHSGIIEWCGDTVIAGTPLHYSLYWGGKDLDIVKRLVEACPEALMMKDMTTHGYTPLHTALRAPSWPDLEVVQFFVECNPSVLYERDVWGHNPIHLALANRNVSVEVIEFLLASCSTNVWEMRDDLGDTPIHLLFQQPRHRMVEDIRTVELLQLFVRLYPNASFFREADDLGDMLIHHATTSGWGVQICQLLVELAPGCERIPNNAGFLPIHGAQRVDTVKYLVGLYPESIYVEGEGMTPFQYAVRKLKGKDRAEIVRYFLELDPTFASTADASTSHLPLHTHVKKMRNCTEVTKILFDYNPSAILVSDTNGKLPVDLAKDALAEDYVEGRRYEGSYKFAKAEHTRTISFLETQQKFVADATSPDENGMLLLHRALLEKDISLGTVKMIVGVTDHNAAVLGPNPLHLACTNCAADVIQYISGVYNGLVNSVDDEGCNILHLVCKVGNVKAAKYLLKNHAPLVLETNEMNLLPIHLLCDKSGKEEIVKESTPKGYTSPEMKEYVDIIWQFLTAHPKAVSAAIAHLD